MKKVIYKESGIYVHSGNGQLSISFDIGNISGKIVEIPITSEQYAEIRKGLAEAIKVMESFFPVDEKYLT